MKKEYVAPQMECVKMDEELPMCVSGGGGGVNLGYGGVDAGGIIDPQSNVRSIWDDVESVIEW